MQVLDGKRVVVTGGFGALGRSVAALLAERGARLALIDRAEEPAQPMRPAQIIGGVDLGDEGACKAAFARAATSLGGIDALVSVAGGFRWETLAEGSVATWDAMYGMNLRTAVLAAQAALPYLLAAGQGRIVHVGAYASQQAALGMGAYAASKAGVSRLTEALAEELKDRGVTVNAVLPTILDTPVNRADMPTADATRWVQPTQLAEVIAFLLQDSAAAVTGALIPVRGRV